jgi:hypothetical protein
VSEAIWRPDLQAVMNWGSLLHATEQSFSNDPQATWWVQKSPAVNYYRAQIPAKHLPGKCVGFEARDIQPDGRGGHYFPRQGGQAAVWLFPANVTRWLAMAEQATSLELRVLVEVDDNYTRPAPLPHKSQWLTTRDNTGQDRHSIEAHRKIVASEACHGIIVSTPKLGEIYERFGKPVYVCPNSIDPDDWKAPLYGGRVVLDPIVPGPSGVLRIGWAGSSSHAYDLHDIHPALDWASRQKDVEIVLLGQLEAPVPHWSFPWTDKLAEYRRNLFSLDVMLCPLRPNTWTNAKSDVKSVEAAAAGACSIMSDVPPYAPWKDKPGYFARTPKEFTKIVKHLVKNPDEARETGRLAQKYVYEERDIRSSIHNWRNAIGVGDSDIHCREEVQSLR